MIKIIYFFILISSAWFIRQAKAILFWLYLWQLKEYHIGRFLDHFRTAKGKKLFFNWLFIFKFFLLFYALFLALYPKSFFWFYYLVWILILIILYFIESAKFFLALFKKQAKMPVLTKKTSTLVLANLFFVVFFLLFLYKKTSPNFYWFSLGLLSFDILSPFLVSFIVLLLQPITVLLRNQIIFKAKRKRETFKDLIVIGITGSYGKTSTKEFLATILTEKFGKDKVLKTKEHQNSEMGVSQCILNDLKPEHKIFVCEMAAYNKGGIKLLSEIIQPKIGIITGVNEQHLATFRTIENLISAEGGKELIEKLPEDGLVIFNGNNKYCQEIYQKTKKPKKISSNTFSPVGESVLSSDIWAENIKVEKEKLSFWVFSKDKDAAEFKVNLLGVYNVENILLAACCAKELGMKLEEIAQACQKLKALPCQMELKKGINELKIIDATYSANPDGVISHLEYLKIWEGKKIIIMPCLIELGKASKEVHKRIGKKISEVCDLAIITTKDRFKEIKEASGEKTLFIENPKEIFAIIKKLAIPNSVILLEGRLPIQLINFLTNNLSINFFKQISISLSPNTEKDDIWLAFKLLFQFWKYKTGSVEIRLQQNLENYLGIKYAISFNSGRSALMAILSSLGLNKGDEVLVQAFTCNAAVNPILWTNLKPVYIDCDERTFNMDIKDLKRKITKRSRVVMVQHTFGLPANLDEILEICQRNNLILIEDCAHSLGAEYHSEKIGLTNEASWAKVGTFGKAAFFSFSRDKIISSIYGGMAITNDEELAKRIKEFQKKIGYPSYFWIFQQLLHPILMNWLILPTYSIFGKYLLILFQWLHILSKAVHWKEKRGRKPGYFPKKMPNVLAILALNQFQKLERFNNHRKEIANFYRQELKDTDFELPLESEQVYLRFTIKHPKAHDIIKKAWQKNLLIGDWYTSPIAPGDTKLEKMYYKIGNCPNAEALAKKTLNLPTHINISKKEAQKIIDFLKSFI